jgi:hypothetical protein
MKRAIIAALVVFQVGKPTATRLIVHAGSQTPIGWVDLDLVSIYAIRGNSSFLPGMFVIRLDV